MYSLFVPYLLNSIPISDEYVVIAKIMYPQTENITENITIPADKIGNNFISALSSGTAEGVRMAVNVGAMLLVCGNLQCIAINVIYQSFHGKKLLFCFMFFTI